MLETLVLVGLGNPGTRYEFTRHNMGFLVLDAIAAKRRLEWKRGARTYHRSEFTSSSARVVLAKPQTYMNLSGEAILELRDTLRFGPEDLLVVVDDIALPFGALRLRRRGSDGGHNGLRSIIEELGTTGFPRLRLGIGPVPPGMDPADFVLQVWPDEHHAGVRGMVRAAVRCVETVLTDGYQRAMDRFNAAPGGAETD
ncbi:MAG: aminoacyl-tRNA hydrolase [bacterium]